MGKIYDEIDRELLRASGRRVKKIIATEIVSSGVEYLYLDPLEFARTDPDYFEFIVNLIRGIE